MGLFGGFFSKLLFWKNATAEEIEKAEINFSPEEEEVSGLNFKTAIDAHSQWKVRLSTYIRGSSTEELKVENIEVDNKCVLGKWIHGEGGEKYGNDIEELKKVHAHFHKEAGFVLKTYLTGNKDGALKQLEAGDYAKYSVEVKRILMQLYLRLKDK
ncbi:MAG: CZB domain-containing protein [Candidatus Sericytochromatia bacterium]